MRNDTTLAAVEDLECIDPTTLCPKILNGLRHLYDDTSGLPVICFVGKCTRVTSSIFPSEVTVVVTLDALYCLDKNYSLIRSIPLQSITELIQGSELWTAFKTNYNYDLLIKPQRHSEGKHLLDIVLAVVMKTVGVPVRVRTTKKQRQIRDQLTVRKPKGYGGEPTTVIRCAPRDVLVDIAKQNVGLMQKKKRQAAEEQIPLPGSPRKSIISANRSCQSVRNVVPSFSASSEDVSSSNPSEGKVEKILNTITKTTSMATETPTDNGDILSEVDVIDLLAIDDDNTKHQPEEEAAKSTDTHPLTIEVDTVPAQTEPTPSTSPSHTITTDATSALNSPSGYCKPSPRYLGSNMDGRRTDLCVLNVSFGNTSCSDSPAGSFDKQPLSPTHPLQLSAYPPIMLPPRGGTAVLIDNNFQTQKIVKTILLGKGFSVTQCITLADAASKLYDSHLIFISAALSTQPSTVSILQMIKSKPYRPRIIITAPSSTSASGTLFPVLDNVAITTEIPALIDRLRNIEITR